MVQLTIFIYILNRFFFYDKLLFVQIENALFLEETDAFTSKVAKTVEEAQKLVEAGFDFVCDFNGAKLFKKRK